MVRIVTAREEHLDDILRIEKECFSLPWTREQLEKQIDEERYVFLAAEDETGAAVGYIGLMYVLDEGYISNVAVTPLRRREGIADMLLSALYEKAREKKLSFLTLEARLGNAAAQSLYKKHGYTQVGLRKNFYDKPREDAVLMTCFLNEE